MLFGQTEGMTIGGFQNGFIGNNVHTECDGVTQELVEHWLVDGNLRVIDQYNNGTSFFAKPEETGWNKPYNKYLENWQFPFVKQENGYYSFDSEKYHVTQNESKIDLSYIKVKDMDFIHLIVAQMIQKMSQIETCILLQNLRYLLYDY